MSSFSAYISALNISINEIYSAFSANGITPPHHLMQLESAPSKSSLDDRIYRYAADGNAKGRSLPMSFAYYANDHELKMCAEDFRDGQGFREIYYRDIKKQSKGGDVSSIVTSIDVRRAERLEANAAREHEDKQRAAKDSKAKLAEGIRKFAAGKGSMCSNKYLVSKGLDESEFLCNFGLYGNEDVLIVPMGTKCEQYRSVEEVAFDNGDLDKVPLSMSFDNLEAMCVKAQFEGGSPIRVNYGESGDKFFFFGKLLGAKRVIICEGISTGIAILQSIGTDRTCLICSCGSKKGDAFFANIRKGFRALRLKKSKCAVLVCADNDWQNEQEGKPNAGVEFGNRVAEELKEFGARVLVAPVKGMMLPDSDKPMTDFCDLFQYGEGRDYYLGQVLEKEFALFKSSSSSLFEGVYSTTTEYDVINKYHASDVEPKLDMTHFPPMFKAYINDTFKDARPSQLGACVLSQLACDAGLIGSQMFTCGASDKRNYVALFVMLVADSTAGKTFAMNAGKSLLNVAMAKVGRVLEDFRKANRATKVKERKASKKADMFMRDKVFSGSIECAEMSINRTDPESDYDRIHKQLNSELRVIELLGKCFPELQSFTMAALEDQLATMRSSLVFAEEFKPLYDRQKRDNGGASMNTGFITLLDSGAKAKRTKNNGSTYIKDACASFCCASTASSFSQCVSSQDVKSGLLSRILFVSMPVINKPATGRLPDDSCPNRDFAAASTEYGNRIISLWNSVFNQAIAESFKGKFACSYRQGAMFYVDRKGSGDYDYKAGNDEFFKYFNKEVVPSLDGVGIDVNAIKSRCEENFIRLAPLFQLMLMDKEEFDNKMLFKDSDGVDHNEEVDENKESDKLQFAGIMDFLNIEDEVKVEPQKVKLSKQSALCAGSIIKYACECAKIAYPCFLDKTPIEASLKRPSAAATNKYIIMSEIAKRFEAGKSTSWNILRQSPDIKAKVEGKDITQSLRELVDEGEICVDKFVTKKGPDGREVMDEKRTSYLPKDKG